MDLLYYHCGDCIRSIHISAPLNIHIYNLITTDICRYTLELGEVLSARPGQHTRGFASHTRLMENALKGEPCVWENMRQFFLPNTLPSVSFVDSEQKLLWDAYLPIRTRYPNSVLSAWRPTTDVRREKKYQVREARGA